LRRIASRWLSRNIVRPAISSGGPMNGVGIRTVHHDRRSTWTTRWTSQCSNGDAGNAHPYHRHRHHAPALNRLSQGSSSAQSSPVLAFFVVELASS
jgi:hypothetical protein